MTIKSITGQTYNAEITINITDLIKQKLVIKIAYSQYTELVVSYRLSVTVKHKHFHLKSQ